MAVKNTSNKETKDQSPIDNNSVVAGTDNFDPLAPIEFDGPDLTEEEEAQEEQAPAEDVLPKSEVMALLAAQEERFMKLLESSKSQQHNLVGVIEKSNKQSYVNELMDDYMEEPAIYFTYSFGWSYHGDFRNGREVLPPGGPIHFKPVIRMRRASKSGGQQTVSVSSCKIHSRAQMEYLETSPMFDLRFHKQMENVANIDSMWATKLVEANTSIARLTDVQVIARCKDMKMRITEDVPAMRRALVNKIAEQTRSLEEKIAAQTRSEIAGYTESNVDGDVAMRHVVQHM